MTADPNLFLFSIDYEDVRSELVGKFDTPDRLPAVTERLLAFLAAHDVRSTFFVSGDPALRHPELIREIVAAGHEIGCHGWKHIPLERYAPAQFKDDVGRTVECLHRAGARRVVGFRAPYLSMIERCAWAYEVLAAYGFVYSSSVLPGRNHLYGWPGFGREERTIGGIYEIPVTVASLLSVSLPFASGATFRAFPWFALRALFGRAHGGDRPLIGYFHPQDIDTEQAKLRYADQGRIGNMLLRYNRGTVLDRLDAIFADGWRVIPYIDYVERRLKPATAETRRPSRGAIA